MLHFLDLPVEIRLQVYHHLLGDRVIKVEANHRAAVILIDNSIDIQCMKQISGIHAYVLRTCRQIHTEAKLVLYMGNVFDVSLRGALDLLHGSIKAPNFALIKSLMLDWEQLETFSWALNNAAKRDCYAGVCSIDLSTWRTRTMGGTSQVWAQNKRYERQLCQAVADILRKHGRLEKLMQRAHAKVPRIARAGGRVDSSRVKWRLIGDEAKPADGEVEVDLEAELKMLKMKGTEAPEMGQQTLDPF